MTTKIAVSLPDDVVEHARRAVKEGRAASVSAFVSEAMAARIRDERLDDYLDELLEKSGGPMTDEERVRIDRILDGE
jgi:Arc/MetJ-type ribon-helix-helix transcriptional regulator